VRIHLCGVRGSTPAPGHQFAGVGGHTSCVALAHDGDSAPTLVLDAGTGLRAVTPLLGESPFHGTILLTHLHWDHTQGLPFFRGGDRPDADVALLLPGQEGPAEKLLARWMGPPFFPILPGQLQGRWRFDTLEEGVHRFEDFHVVAREIPHKGGRTFGYRVSDGRATIAYLSDHGPSALGPGPDGWGEYHDVAVALAEGVDLLIHDAQHTSEELPAVKGYGHSAADYPVALAELAGARAVLLFHHDPNRTDDAVLTMADDLADRASVPVDAAVEGTVITLPA
jgi:phosphoribosyl 1,2-cyclic phosphodiesterase